MAHLPVIAREAAAVVVLSAGFAAAQALPSSTPEIFAPPAGCVGFVTVQMRGCVVANHYICDQDRPGDQWTVLFDMTGPFHLSRIDGETQWVETVSLPQGAVSWLQDAPADAASFSQLLRTGVDTYDFGTVSDVGVVTAYRGQDALTGEKVTIDGVALERTKFNITATAADGSVLWRREGNELISREWRIFLSDIEVFDDADGPRTVVSTPVEFVFPGEPGFFATRPKFDCDALLARNDAPPGTEEATNDQL